MSDTTTAFSLRQAGVSDARTLTELGARLFEQTFGAANTAEDMRVYLSTAFRLDELTADLADDASAIWIAEDSTGTAIGYAVLRRGTSADGVVAAQSAEIQRIYADRAWHGRGVGHELMRACLKQARAWGCDAVWLAVWEQNPRAIAFYEKVGFRAVGKQTFVLGSDVQQDVVMMR
jgi:ribosomal protein S18 acetylase RimI-like enzyme